MLTLGCLFDAKFVTSYVFMLVLRLYSSGAHV